MVLFRRIQLDIFYRFIITYFSKFITHFFNYDTYGLQDIVEAIYKTYQVIPDLDCSVDKNGRQLLLGVNLCLDLDLELTSCSHTVYLI